jgi:hypothetical protein
VPDYILNVVRCKCSWLAVNDRVPPLISVHAGSTDSPVLPLARTVTAKLAKKVLSNPLAVNTDDELTIGEDDREDVEMEKPTEFVDLVPYDCVAFDLPNWIDEEIVTAT